MYMYSIVVSAGLNTFQVNVHVHQVNREIANQAFTFTNMYTQLYVHVVPSKLIAACNIPVQ